MCASGSTMQLIHVLVLGMRISTHAHRDCSELSMRKSKSLQIATFRRSRTWFKFPFAVPTMAQPVRIARSAESNRLTLGGTFPKLFHSKSKGPALCHSQGGVCYPTSRCPN
ncbi:hypothetical protein B0J12DRAFT_647678 [Macrophomina phaseolina]|uniref:Secreted protein n=1 Tax=Macrophomina phaseolina TaxID=35725 RepID=A0ABQ8GNR1_9PEZI|nr:hypothetical protein B0J12DRAFT_647678 [Macrophomina phaseolina]